MANLPLIDDLTKTFVSNQFISDLRQTKLDPSLIIDTNSFGKQTRYIGTPESHYYPEIVVWRPTSLTTGEGKAVAAGVVENEKSLDTPTIEKWRFLSSIGILFYLLVPSSKVTLTQTLLNGYTIKNVFVVSYIYDPGQKRYVFTVYPRT